MSLVASYGLEKFPHENGPMNLIEIDDVGTEENKSDAPLRYIKPSTIESLSTLLNPTKIIPTEGGLLRDWRGLAELVGISIEQIVSLETKENPTSELIKLWIRQERRNISDLKAYLAVIDRFDIFDDISPFLDIDVASYWSQKEKIQNGSAISGAAEVLNPNDNEVLTIGDADGTKLSHYDAFILYAEEDSEFAMQIVDKMENQYKLKICVKDRDLLGGTMFEHETIGRLIEERCNRLLAIFSPNFLKSQANQFLVSFAQALALERRQRKIIPCMYIRCELPPSVRYSFCLDYNRSGKLWNFWDKLGQSIRTNPASASAIDIPNSVQNSISLPYTQATSLPANTFGSSPAQPQSIDTKYDWWVANKPRKHSSYSTSDSGVLEDLDTMSLHSVSPLVSSSSSAQKGQSSHSKFQSFKRLKKILTPNKKKTQREKEACLEGP